MRGKILVSGLLNMETTLRVEAFPVRYSPVRYAFWDVNSTLSGVGYNVARALTTLGDPIHFLSLVGTDILGDVARTILGQQGVPADRVLPLLPQSAQSVVLFDGSGRRQIHVDLKNVQETAYPAELFEAAAADCDLAVLSTINFSRPFLAQARAKGLLVATDVHMIADLEDDYNRDFMAAAHILFMSDGRLPTAPEVWAQALFGRYGAEIIVIGMGEQGALLAVRQDGFMERIPAVYTRPVVNTIGAGDALFSAFVHAYHQAEDPYTAIHKAMIFASYKIGANGGAEGFLPAAELEATWLAANYNE
jgi:acarbose 7IV-phosphotransferase